MSRITLYPELVEYIFDYCSAFMTETEQKAKWHYIAMVKSNRGKIGRAYTYSNNRNPIGAQEDALNLLKKGYKDFKENVAENFH